MFTEQTLEHGEIAAKKLYAAADLGDAGYSAGSRTPLAGAVGRAVEKTRQAEQAEAHHAKAHGHENVIEACSEPDRGSAKSRFAVSGSSAP
jgi:hypothetical protein